MQRYVEDHGGSAGFETFLAESFGPREVDQFTGRVDQTDRQVARLLAKQLVVEMVDLRGSLRDVEVLAEPSGRPFVASSVLPVSLLEHLHVSVSHDAAMAAALVVLDRDRSAVQHLRD